MKAGKKRLPLPVRIVLGILIAAAVINGLLVLGMLLAFRRSKPSLRAFDAAAEGLLEVRTEIVDRDRHIGEQRSYILADGFRIMAGTDLEPDPATVYLVPYGCFESYIDHRQNKVLNRLIRVAVTDEKEVPCPAPDIMQDIFPAISELEHDLFTVQIFEDAGEYFVYVEKNVNLWSPCALYYYDREAKRLTELYTWDDEKVVGIRMISADRLHALGQP